MALMTPESTDDSQANSAELSSLQLGAWKQQFAQHPTAQLMQNAVTQNGVDNVALPSSDTVTLERLISPSKTISPLTTLTGID